MNLTRLTERIWYYPFEQERDRPILALIRGDHFSVAIDAGHSAAHTKEFYRALEDAGLPLPQLTLLTHWHWDHTFGMHAVHGLCVANERTNRHLLDFRDQISSEGPDNFLALDESIRLEYAGGRPIIVTPADIVFSGEMTIDAGHCPIRLTCAVSPHTDDSTLIHVMDEKVLFIGDAGGGTFPTWERDMTLSRALAETIATIDAGICVESHRIPETRQQLIHILTNENAR